MTYTDIITDLNVALSQTACSFPFMDEEMLKKFKFVIICAKNPDGSKVTGMYLKLYYRFVIMQMKKSILIFQKVFGHR